MKLKSITLNNFKGMDNIEFSLDQKTTVIFGINGVGKSTILKAIDLLYANIIAKLTKKQQLKQNLFLRMERKKNIAVLLIERMEGIIILIN